MKNEAALGHLARTVEPEERVLFKDFAWQWHETYVKANNREIEQKTKESYLRIHLVPFFGDMYIDSIVRRDVEEFKAVEVRAGQSPASINHYLKCLQKLFQCALEWELVANNPVRGVPRLKASTNKWQFLDFEEMWKFMKAVPPKWRPLFLCAFRTGLRQGEILALRWQDVDWKRRMIMVRHSLSNGQLCPTKSYTNREVPIANDLFEMLFSIQNNDSAFVFPAGDGGPLHRKTLQRPLATANKQSGVKRIRFHDTRHSFASQLIMVNVSVRTIQELLGHADLAMTMRYAHLVPRSKQEAIEQLESLGTNQGCGEFVASSEQ